jgi:hypothetical protein
MGGHLAALVPRQGEPQVGRQGAHRGPQADRKIASRVPVREVDEMDVAGLAVHDRADRRTGRGPHNEVSLPVPAAGSCLDHSGSGVDQA